MRIITHLQHIFFYCKMQLTNQMWGISCLAAFPKGVWIYKHMDVMRLLMQFFFHSLTVII